MSGSRDAQEARRIAVRLGEYVGAAYSETVTHGRLETIAGLLHTAMSLACELQDCLRRELEGPDEGLGL